MTLGLDDIGGAGRAGGERLVELADPLREGVALLLDDRARLALHRQPLRQQAVDAGGRAGLAARLQHLHEQAADQHDLAGRDRRSRHPLVADPHAVGAAEVLDPREAVVEVEARVLARHARVIAADRALGGASDHHRLDPQLEGPIASVDVAVEQRGHDRGRSYHTVEGPKTRKPARRRRRRAGLLASLVRCARARSART
jgi:hypothetical protein